MKTIKEPARDIPVRAEADVLVVGGGPAGIMAAEAAAGDGLRVMLVESRGFLGGNLTIGLPILGFLGRKGNQIIEGSAQRFIDRLRARGAASEHRPCKNHMSLTIIDEEEVKRTALAADPNAFITVCSVRDVSGRGFTLTDVRLPLDTL